MEFVGIPSAQYLPPGGRGTAKRWMRNGDTFPFLTQSSQRVLPFPMYLFNEMHTDSEHIAVPHPPQCAHWGTFPPGEGIIPSSLQTPIYRAAEENRYAHNFFVKKPELISGSSFGGAALFRFASGFHDREGFQFSGFLCFSPKVNFKCCGMCRTSYFTPKNNCFFRKPAL